MHIVDHWITDARRCLSPNQGPRPPGAEVDLVVIHNISLPPGQFGGGWVERFFLNRLPADAHPYFATICDLEVSAHLLVARDGALTQFVPFDRRAWHAGRSCWQGRENCNDYSIGIELEGTDDQPYEEAQYHALVEVLKALMATYPAIRAERIVGHCDVAPERKTDPGPAFDWPRLRRMLAENC